MKKQVRKKSNVGKRVSIKPLIDIGDMVPQDIEDAHVKKSEHIEELVEPVFLISRLNHPTTVNYNGSVIRVSPRGKVKVADRSKLDEQKLPSGIIVKSY